jgi:hypothetical protein
MIESSVKGRGGSGKRNNSLNTIPNPPSPHINNSCSADGHMDVFIVRATGRLHLASIFAQAMALPSHCQYTQSSYFITTHFLFRPSDLPPHLMPTAHTRQVAAGRPPQADSAFQCWKADWMKV